MYHFLSQILLWYFFCYFFFSFFFLGDIPRHSSCRYSIDYFWTSFEKEKKIDLLYCITLKMFDNSLLLQISQVFLSNLNNTLKFNVCFKCKDKTPSPHIDILQGFLFSCFCYIFSLVLWISLECVVANFVSSPPFNPRSGYWPGKKKPRNCRVCCLSRYGESKRGKCDM